MHIVNEYTPDPQELSKASLIYLEKKPLLQIIIFIVNLFAILFFLLICVKIAITLSIAWQEIIALLFTGFWIFGRKPFNLWLFKRRMNESVSLKSPIKIEITLNGIAWSGQRLKKGSIPYDDLKWVLRVKNGFIIPSHISRFLWLPDHGFKDHTNEKQFFEFLVEKNIPLRIYDEWEC